MALQVHQILPWATDSLLSAESYSSALEVLLPLSDPLATVTRSQETILLRRKNVRHPNICAVAVSDVSDVPLQLFEEGLVDIAVKGPATAEVRDAIKEHSSQAVVLVTDSEGWADGGKAGATVVKVNSPNEVLLLASIFDKAVATTTQDLAAALSSAAASAKTTTAVIDPNNSTESSFSILVTDPENKSGSETVSTASGAVSAALGRLSPPKSDSNYAVQISALNGLATINFGIVVSDVLTQLEALTGTAPSAVFTSNFSTGRESADSFGFAVSVLCCGAGLEIPPPAAPAVNLEDQIDQGQRSESKRRKLYSPASRAIIEAACRRLILSEPEITRMDTIAGDGDCGTTLRAGATAVLVRVLGIHTQPAPGSDPSDTPHTTPATSDDGQGGGPEIGTLSDLLDEIADALEGSMGGTSGIVLTILFRSWARAAADSNPDDLAASLSSGLATLMRYTPARKNDRTLLDALIPFADALEKNGSEQGEWKQRVADAVRAASEGCEATKSMRPGLGRAIYVPREGIEGVPDAGALGVVRVLEGVEDAVKRVL